jgi:PilZ domain
MEFNRAGGISCTVRNISERGACLAVASPLGIPDDFDLIVESDRLRQSCHVAWRSEKQLGVAFQG